jgi:DNA-binding NtrC family response regulator
MNDQKDPSSESILIIDDEKHALESMSFLLNEMGRDNIITCQDSSKAQDILSQKTISLILLDLVMAGVSGDELLPYIQTEYPDVPIIIVSGSKDLNRAVDYMRGGVFDFVSKPVDKERLFVSVRRAIEMSDLRNVHHHLTRSIFYDSLGTPDAFRDIVTQNAGMRSVFQYCEAVATSHEPVLVYGETGTGKELISQAIHQASQCAGPFIGVNLAGVDGQMFSDTLFGHSKGAFTGADQQRKGLVEQAEHGTLFMDEIGDLDMSSQVKLLRLIQEQEYYPLGADIPKPSNIRIVCATNHNLWEKVAEGTFRKDLYYRLRTYRVHLPPLRSRIDDLPLLLDHFIQQAAEDIGIKAPHYPPKWISELKNASFPGNIRELRGIVYEAVAHSNRGQLSLKHFHNNFLENSESIKAPHQDSLDSSCSIEDHNGLSFSTFPTLKKAQDFLIEEAMRRSDGKQSLASRMLGISPPTLCERLKRKKKSESQKASS